MYEFFLASVKTDEIQYDIIYDEIQQYLPKALETGPEKAFKDAYAPNTDVTYFESKGVIHKGTIPGYKVLSLTYSDVKNSEYGFNHFRNNMSESEWHWRDDLVYTKSVIDNLPFEKYYIVKLVYLPKNGAGVLHTDSVNYNADSISIEVCQNDSKLDIHYNGKIYNPLSRCFIFDDSVLHGVETSSNERIILRVFGKFKSNFRDYLDLDTAVYYD